MNRCLILFFWTTWLMLLTDRFSLYFNSYVFQNKVMDKTEKKIYEFIERITGAIFVISALIFGITLVFAVYIFIFQ